MRYYAHALPGLGEILAQEVAESTRLRGPSATDGRNDIVAFDASSAPVLRCADDVFAQVETVRRSRHPGRLAAALLNPDGLERALSAYANVAGGLRASMGFRVVTRVRSEDTFRRTDLRRALYERIATLRPRWREADPAEIEIWVAEEGRTWRSGIRLTGGPRSRRTSRTQERAGALRPSVAAAMVRMAGRGGGTLLDPCCGTGTILIEAAAAGWRPIGCDIDPAALRLATGNVAAPVAVADARALPVRPGAVGAVVSNLPFGRRFAQPESFVADTLDAMVDVTTPGTHVVLLAPQLTTPPRYELDRRLSIDLLGQPTALWSLRRV